MTPDIDVRLQSVIKAIEQVILPALDPNNPLAREQAALAIGHLHMIRGQWPYMADYMAVCLADIVKLGADLLKVADGGLATRDAASALKSTLDQAGKEKGGPTTAIAQRRDAIAVAVDDLINASAVDGSQSFRDSSENIVLDYGIHQTSRDRAWFKASGLDPDCAKLPSHSDLLAAPSHHTN